MGCIFEDVYLFCALFYVLLSRYHILAMSFSYIFNVGCANTLFSFARSGHAPSRCSSCPSTPTAAARLTSMNWLRVSRALGFGSTSSNWWLFGTTSAAVRDKWVMLFCWCQCCSDQCYLFWLQNRLFLYQQFSFLNLCFSHPCSCVRAPGRSNITLPLFLEAVKRRQASGRLSTARSASDDGKKLEYEVVRGWITLERTHWR